MISSPKIDSSSDLTRTEYSTYLDAAIVVPHTSLPAQASGFIYPNLGNIGNVGLRCVALNPVANAG